MHPRKTNRNPIDIDSNTDCIAISLEGSKILWPGLAGVCRWAHKALEEWVSRHEMPEESPQEKDIAGRIQTRKNMMKCPKRFEVFKI